MNTTTSRSAVSLQIEHEPDNAAHDRANDELAFRFIRALAVEKAALDNSLEPICIRVLAAISYFMNGRTKRSYPSYAQIAEVTDYSQDRIERSIKKLCEAGYIFRERKAVEKGGRALVHYGLKSIHPLDIDGVVTAAVEAYRASLTPPEMPGSELPDPGKNAGVGRAHPVENAGVSSKVEGAHPVKNAGVRVPDPGKNAGVSPADPGIFAGSNPMSKRKSKSADETKFRELEAVRASAARSHVEQPSAFPDLFDASPVPGVTFPTAVLSAIEGGTAKVAAETLIDAVKAQLRAGATREQIEASMRKAAVDLALTEAKPAPSMLLRKVLTYVERAVSQRVAQPAYVPGTTTERIQNIPFGYADPDAPIAPRPTPVSGVEYPSVILTAIENNEAPMAALNLNEAIEAALRRQVPAAQIEAAMRNAVGWLTRKGNQQPYPSDLLARAQQFIESEERRSSAACPAAEGKIENFPFGYNDPDA